MARRRNFFKKARRRFSAARVSRRSSRRSDGGGLMLTAGGAAIYGAARQRISDLAAPITSRIPLGGIADEVALGVGGYYLAKKSSMPLLKSIGRAAMTIEAARIGEAVATGSLGLGGGSSSQGITPFVLGR